MCFLTCESSSHTTQIKEGKGWDWETEELAMVGGEQVWDPLRNLKVHKSMGLAERNPQALSELAEEVSQWQCGT